MKQHIGKSAFRRFVYEHTRKPEHYVRVGNPKTLQEHRQVQYNGWCRRYGVYNGSYLPEDPDTLKRKGWWEITRSGSRREFQRKSSGQMVGYDGKKYKRGRWEDEHYHWYNARSIVGKSRLKRKSYYIDRYGKICAYGSEESHIAPKDRKYNYRK